MPTGTSSASHNAPAVFDAVRPLVVLEYAARDIWNPAAPPSTASLPIVRNTSAHDAWNVVLSDILLDADTRCRFPFIPRLRAGEARAIERVSSDNVVNGRIERHPTSLTTAVSQAVVRRLLARREAITNWRMTIDYEDRLRDRYLTVCELAVWELPLELRSTNVCVGAVSARPAW